jgi:hypothetical protein
MKDVNIGSPVVVTDMSNHKDKSDNNNIEKNVLYKTENAKDIRRTVREKDKNNDISEEPAFEIRYGTVYL